MLKKDLISNPDSCLNKCLEDQEAFLLIEPDPCMPLTIMAWILLRVGLGYNNPTDDTILEAKELALGLYAKDANPENLDVLMGKEFVEDIRDGMYTIFRDYLCNKKTIDEVFPDKYKRKHQSDILETMKLLSDSTIGIVGVTGWICKNPYRWGARYYGPTNDSNDLKLADLASDTFFEAVHFRDIEINHFFLQSGMLYYKKDNITAIRVNMPIVEIELGPDTICSKGTPCFRTVKGSVYTYDSYHGNALLKLRPLTVSFFESWEKTDDIIGEKEILYPYDFYSPWWKTADGEKIKIDGIEMTKTDKSKVFHYINTRWGKQ